MVSTAINRMQFLRGDFSGRGAPIRPPWAVSEQQFLQKCDGCGDCMSQCPTHILKRGRARYPLVDFSSGECLFCGDCAAACRTGALQRLEGRAPWLIKASIDTDQCIAYRGVECRSCVDPCESRAIRMLPRVGGAAIPELDTSSCTGCGACFSVCPVQALSLSPARMLEETR
jgi:ferredoxin-type protein NapF